MMRCLRSSLLNRKQCFSITSVTPCHNSHKSTSTLLTQNWTDASKGRDCASHFSSALLDTSRNMTSTKSINTEERLVWIDMEMTGLDVDTCHIIEIACLITDSDLEIVSDDFHVVIHQPDDILDSMNAWCVEQHGKTGLTAASRASKISLKEAERMISDFLATHVPEKKCPLAGNTVWMDRIFLEKYMPTVEKYMHYRIVDVSTVKELARRWFPLEYKSSPIKQFNHRALDDIRESINELKFYKSKIFQR